MAVDIENVTNLDVAVSALKQYYKAGESEGLSFVMGMSAKNTEWLETQQVLGNLEDISSEVVTTLPAEQMRKLGSLILDNTEGGYFVKDLLTSSEVADKLASFISDVGELEIPSYIESVEAKDIIQIVYEASVASESGLEICDSVNSVSSLINQTPASTGGESGSEIQDSNEFKVNSGDASHRINNPGLAAFVLPNSKFSLATRNTDAVALFLNSIPTIEMSRCTPFIDIKFISSVDPTIEQERKEMTILNFLGANNSDSDGIRLGEIGTVPSEYADDIINTSDGQFVNIGTSGMELFTSPQTMINPNGTAFDNMVPFMTLEKLTVDTHPLGQALLSDKTATLSFTLHDRSRLAEIAPLVSMERFGSTYLAIEWGWSHPEGSNPDVNPYGYLINAMRSRGNFTVHSTNFNLGADGQMKLNMRLSNRPDSDVKIFPITCGSFMPIAPIRSLVESLVAKQQAFKVNENLDWEQVDILPKLTLLTEDPISAGSMIPRGVFKSVIAAMDKSGGLTADQFLEEIEGLNKDTLIGAKDASLISEIIKKQARLMRKTGKADAAYVPDPFFPQAFHNNQKVSFDFKYNAKGAIVEAVPENNWSKAASPGFVSLGKIFMEFVGGPLAACGKYDEVQMFFYRFNSKSGAARLYDSIASFVVNAAEFEVRVLMKLMGGNESLSIEKFVSLFNDEFISKVDDPNYGISILKGAEDAASAEGTEDTATAADINIINSKVKDAMRLIYMEGGGEPVFKPPRLAMYLENVPRIVPADDDATNSDDEPAPIRRHVDRSQTIVRVHIYDMNASPYDQEEFILRAATKGTAAVSVVGDSPITRPFRPMGLNQTLSSAVDSEIVKKASESTDAEFQSYISNVPSSVIKEFIKQTVPSITIGQGFTGVQSFSMAANTSGPVNNVIMLNAIDDHDTIGDTAGNKRLSGIDPITVIPATVQMTTFGCPLIEYGSMFFVDIGSNTNADNFYIVNKISHTLSAGRFETSLGLKFADSGTIKNLRATLASQEKQE